MRERTYIPAPPSALAKAIARRGGLSLAFANAQAEILKGAAYGD
tara:strand:- start:7520 stop:7651 length:132 start_codon:yes stop_codon:yes gene_type:complete